MGTDCSVVTKCIICFEISTVDSEKKLTFIQFKSLSIIKSPKLMYPSHFPKPSRGPDLCRTNSGPGPYF